MRRFYAIEVNNRAYQLPVSVPVKEAENSSWQIQFYREETKLSKAWLDN